MTINLLNRLCRVAIGMTVALQQACKVGEPHPCCESLPCDVTECREHLGAVLRQEGEIAGEVPCCKNFAGEFHLSALHIARAAQLALDLCRFEQLRMQVEAFACEKVQLLQHRDINSDRCDIRCLGCVSVSKADRFTRVDTT